MRRAKMTSISLSPSRFPRRFKALFPTLSSPAAARASGAGRAFALAFALALALPLALGLAGCVSSGTTGSAGRPSRPSRPADIRPAHPSGQRDPQFMTMRGLEGVIGVTERELVRQFGQPRLNVWEGDARKLQFAGRACLLDIYLYPTSSSKIPVATYVDARRQSDGQDVDRAACVAALRQR